MERFENLTPEAAVDLRRSRRIFGAEQTLNPAGEIARAISAHRGRNGHRHRFAGGASGKVLCLTVAPLLIFYDADTRDILRIVDGRRDLTALFDEGT